MKTAKQQTKVVLNGMPCIQNGKIFYFCSLPSEMLTCFHFDIHDPLSGEGYNRDDDLQKRGKEFCEFISENTGFCPNPILVNLRDNSVQIKNKKNGIAEITLDNNSKLYVWEGQGRVTGYRMAHEEGYHLQIPVMITQVSRPEEIYHCRITDQKRKKMKTNMKYSQSYQTVISRIKQGEDFKTIEKNLLVEAVCYRTMLLMNKNKNSVLYRRLVMPNEKVQEKNERIINLNKKDQQMVNDKTLNMSSHMHSNNLGSFVVDFLNSNMYRYSSFNSMCQEIYKIVNGYWNALRKVNPQIFSATRTLYGKDEKGCQTEILHQGYHTLFRNGCFVLYPILRILYGRGVKTEQEFFTYLSKSKTLKDTGYWEENKLKTSGMEIVNHTKWVNERLSICKEIGLGQ